MNSDPDNYYILFEELSLDPNQWSILIDSIAILLTLIGLLFAFVIYRKQRKDNAKDAFDFFQSSLPELRQSILATIENLRQFVQHIDADRFIHPILSPTLNDKFLGKINLVDLNRFYKKHRANTHALFRNFLVHSNFFGSYHAYFTQEIDAFGTHYLKKQAVLKQWKLLRSAPFFESAEEQSGFQEHFVDWVENLNQDTHLFHFNDKGWPTKIKNRQILIEHHMAILAEETFAFVPISEKANEVNRIAGNVVTAYTEMSEMKINFRDVLEKDIARFGEVLTTLNGLMEEKKNE